MNVAVIFHGDDSELPDAEKAVKRFVDTCRLYSRQELELYCGFIRVDFPPPVEVFEKDASYGYFAREKDLKPVLDQHRPCGVIRIYDHGRAGQAFAKEGTLPSDWAAPGAMALSWSVVPPYTALAWDSWLDKLKNKPEPVQNVLIHEFLHQLDYMFKRVGVGNFMGSHKGVDKYDDAFAVLDDQKTPVPWQSLGDLTGADWR
ncbi:hypothetical protein PC39_16233 [Salinisphaera sp. PC39]